MQGLIYPARARGYGKRLLLLHEVQAALLRGQHVHFHALRGGVKIYCSHKEPCPGTERLHDDRLPD